jgi:hypothetical protein
VAEEVVAGIVLEPMVDLAVVLASEPFTQLPVELESLARDSMAATPRRDPEITALFNQQGLSVET